MARKNQAKYALLGLLTHEPMSGYDIKKKIAHSISYFWDASYGQIYPELKSLERDGLVSKTVRAGDSRPERKVYSITGKGQEELVAWLSLPAAKEQMRYEILLKLFFGSLVPPSVSRHNIRGFQKRSNENLAMMEKIESQLNECEGTHFYPLLTVLLGKKIYKATVEWSDEAIALLDLIGRGEETAAGTPCPVKTGRSAPRHRCAPDSEKKKRK